jgi:hypothetical protein
MFQFILTLPPPPSAQATTLDTLSYNKDVGTRLKTLISAQHTHTEMPHLLLHGHPGCGLKHVVSLIIKELYGQVHLQKVVVNKAMVLGRSVNHSEYSSQTQSIDMAILADGEKRSSDASNFTHMIKMFSSGVMQKTLQVFVIHDVENVNTTAMNALKRTMETCSTNYRFILTTHNTALVNEAIRSRCVSVALPSPSATDIETYLRFAHPLADVTKISQSSNHNLKLAIKMTKDVPTIYTIIQSLFQDSLKSADVRQIFELTRQSMTMFVDINELISTILYFIGKIYDAKPTLPMDPLRTFCAEIGDISVDYYSTMHKEICLDTIMLKTIILLKTLF